MDDNSIIDDGDDDNNDSDDYESMSIKDLRRLLLRRGFDSLSVDQDHLVAAARRLDQTDFDDQARRIFQQLNLEPSLADRYENLNAIWKHPVSSGGCGTVYVGNAAAASPRRIAKPWTITTFAPW